MSTDPAKNPREAEWKRLNAALGAAKADLLDSIESDDRSAAQRVVDQLAPYADPQRQRAAVIQVFARDLGAQIRAFDSTRANLTERAGLLLMRASQASAALSAAMLARAMEAVQHDPGPRGSQVSERLEQAEGELEALDELGREIGWELERSLRFAAGLIALRESELAAYLEEVPELDRGSLWGTLSAVVAEEGAGRVAEEILTRGVGLAVPVASIALGVVEAGRSIREKVKAMEAHYEPGPLDRMFELAQQVTDDRELIELVLTLFDAVDRSFERIIATD